ncbi:MAG: 4-hydroxythreonine-4-phosphate dehydrogenase PdxA [Bacteroidales bacterium]|nr:4-hydroxythreonine-4-phosphate dehydrogenase PdxA [Bacteroidales bacterium]
MTDNNNLGGGTASPEYKAAAQTAPAAGKPLRVGITHGDINGVGYELILKTFAETGMLEICTPVVFGSVKVANYHRKALGLETGFHVVSSAADAVDGRLNLVNCFDEDVTVEFGKINPEAGHAAYVALEASTDALKTGEIDVLVTAPICKSAIQSADFRFVGHTEYLCNRIGGGAEPLMILANRLMRVALVTTHLPIQDVAKAITQEAVSKKIQQLYRSLRHDFLIPAPRIAVLGLNPHNGDNGALGHEEQNIIEPAVKEAVENGIQCFGPYSADGFFGAGLYSSFDGILAMYHDQALAPFKALSMEDGVNFTAGLPYVRTSPDHGTAFDIAGRGEASAASFRQAIYDAIDIYRHRQADDEAHKNPLPKLYHERREDSNRNRHLQPQQAGKSAEGKAEKDDNKVDAEN